MKATIIKKFNLIISLWLIVIIGCLVLFGYSLGLSGLYVAALVVASLLLASNTVNVVSGIIAARPKAMQRQKEYN